jgi:hypothetical protein
VVQLITDILTAQGFSQVSGTANLLRLLSLTTKFATAFDLMVMVKSDGPGFQMLYFQTKKLWVNCGVPWNGKD